MKYGFILTLTGPIAVTDEVIISLGYKSYEELYKAFTNTEINPTQPVQGYILSCPIDT